MISVEKKNIPSYAQWRPATWDDYQRVRDDESIERVQLFFYRHQLLLENMGWEGILHSEVRELVSAILTIWLIRHPEIKSKLLGSCLMEKEGLQAAAPDIALYLGENLPQYQQSRRINLNQSPPPALVVEVADTTLDSDLDQKKHLYAELGIPEYWVMDAQGGQVFLFVLHGSGYQRVENSQVLPGLTSSLLQATMAQAQSSTNIAAAAWFAQQFS
ncbi:MAG: Uma2 family endonuclease [Gloeomargarita sp. SKYBB_i_bin120]|nr:Uma2 family endonuclease [Gloeomargarita sp. SKYG98]MCS7292052.1 Uma2 family endonuclease [Gloeomargarita sp. SKYB120]MDW8177612.1 Uma2 family endonuclease [Gloeomargarita sp. SKYBB_i_bin120]